MTSQQLTTTPHNLALLPFSDLTTRFLTEQFNITPSSAETYRKALKNAFSWFRGQGIAFPPTTQDIVRYRDELRADNKSAQTISLRIAALRQFFKWLEIASNGKITNPAAAIKTEKKPDGYLKGALTRPQIEHLFWSFEKNSVVDVRDHALLYLLASTALRSVEAQRADIKDIETNGKTILRVQGKARASRDGFVYLNEPCKEAIQQYLSLRNAQPNDPLFISHSNKSCGDRLSLRGFHDVVTRRLENAGLKRKGISVHSFRHFVCTEAAKNGSSLEDIQMMVRHQDPRTTMRYTRLVRREKTAPEFSMVFSPNRQKKT